MPETKAATDLSERVFQIVRTYLMSRTERKCGIAWEDFKDKRITDPDTGKQRISVPEDYRNARESVATNAFLRVRACRSREDFVDYFTGTIFSVPQYLPQDQYREVSAAILNPQQWEDVKALTMLALSGLSRV